MAHGVLAVADVGMDVVVGCGAAAEESRVGRRTDQWSTAVGMDV